MTTEDPRPGLPGSEDPTGTDRAEDAPGPPGGGWVAWVVALFALAVPSVLAGLAYQAFTDDSLTRLNGLTPVDEDGDGDVWDISWQLRFSLLWRAVPVPLSLLAPLAALFILCAVLVSGRPRWLLPSPPARWIATAAAALVVAESVTAAGVLLSQAVTHPRDGAGTAGLQLTSSPTSGQLPDVGLVALVLLGCALFATLAAVTVLRERPPGPVLDAPAPPPLTDPCPATDRPSRPIAPVATSPQPPRPSQEEEVLYRRPPPA
ncbi:hypothetical protein AB2L28_04545 [Kineococcus sp. TBRC 1896]|uniref:Uncharacterized protein n=1 Tax=Kineococcus mangrovi TaxID=1660183 RepID=A0ABV4I0E5_9ACTN